MTSTQLPRVIGREVRSASAEPTMPGLGETAGRLPFPVGMALFFSTMGALLEFSFMFYVQLLVVPMTVFGYALLGIGTKKLKDIRIEIFLFPILFWLLMSIGWTQGALRDATQNVLLNLMLVLSAHVAASVFDAERVLRFLAMAAVVMAAVVFLHAFARPAQAFSAGRGDIATTGIGLRSFYYHKNSLGGALVLGFAIRAAIRPAWLRVSYTGLVVVLLVLCRSSTSIIAAAVIAVLQYLSARIVAERRRGGSGSTFIFTGVAIGLAATVFAAREHVFALFGKDASLTGRTIIWRYAWRAVQDHPWVGYGPAGFWEPSSNRLSELRHAAGWQVVGSHQGLLDQWLEYGIVGVVLILIAYVAVAVRVVSRILAGDNSPLVPAALGLWTAAAVGSLTEGVLIRPGLVTVGLVSALLLNTPMSLPFRGDVRPGDRLGQLVGSVVPISRASRGATNER